jgi:hypothetical protein
LFAKAGAATLLLAPVLRSRSAHAGQGEPRLLVVSFPNGSPGHPDEVFFPSGSGAGSWSFAGRVTEPLAGFADRMSVVRRLKTNRGQRPKGAHGAGNVAFLTGTSALNHLDSDFHTPTSHSIDHHVAQAAGQSSLYIAMGLNATANSRISWIGDDQPNQEVDEPQAAYDLAFGNWLELCQQGATAVQAHVRKKTFVLDAMAADLATARNSLGLDASEREKLDRYADGLADLEAEIAQLADGDLCGSEGPPEIDLGAETVPGSLSAFRQIVAYALALGTHNAAVLQLFHGYNQQNYGSFVPDVASQGHHSITHDVASGAAGDSRAIVRWHAEQLADLLGLLDDLPGSSGSVLDDIVVLWGTDVPNAFTHDYAEPAPNLVFGSGGGRLVPGLDVDLGERNHVDLLATLCRAVDVDSTHFEQRTGFGSVIEPLLGS